MGVVQTTCKTRFQAQIRKVGKQFHLGRFNTPEEAHEAYKKAKIKHILEIAQNLTEDDTSHIEKTRQGLIRHVKEGLIFK